MGLGVDIADDAGTLKVSTINGGYVKSKSMNQRLADAGVKTIRNLGIDRNGREIVMLEFNGAQVRRPYASECERVCLEQLGVQI